MRCHHSQQYEVPGHSSPSHGSYGPTEEGDGPCGEAHGGGGQAQQQQQEEVLEDQEGVLQVLGPWVGGRHVEPCQHTMAGGAWVAKKKGRRGQAVTSRAPGGCL